MNSLRPRDRYRRRIDCAEGEGAGGRREPIRPLSKPTTQPTEALGDSRRAQLKKASPFAGEKDAA